MSSETSSSRVDSGNAFDSLSPSNQEDRQTPEFSLDGFFMMGLSFPLRGNYRGEL